MKQERHTYMPNRNSKSRRIKRFTKSHKYFEKFELTKLRGETRWFFNIILSLQNRYIFLSPLPTIFSANENKFNSNIHVDPRKGGGSPCFLVSTKEGKERMSCFIHYKPPGAGVGHPRSITGIVVDEVEHGHLVPLRDAVIELLLVVGLPLVKD